MLSEVLPTTQVLMDTLTMFAFAGEHSSYSYWESQFLGSIIVHRTGTMSYLSMPADELRQSGVVEDTNASSPIIG